MAILRLRCPTQFTFKTKLLDFCRKITIQFYTSNRLPLLIRLNQTARLQKKPALKAGQYNWLTIL